jgi:hypothetical protein
MLYPLGYEAYVVRSSWIAGESLPVGFGLVAWFPTVCAASVPHLCRVPWTGFGLPPRRAGRIVQLVVLGHFRTDGVGQGSCDRFQVVADGLGSVTRLDDLYLGAATVSGRTPASALVSWAS